MLRIAVCDDDRSAAEDIRKHIAEYKEVLECTFFLDSLELSSVIQSGKKFDLYLLDIVMPSLTGVELAREIRTVDQHCMIIFMTSSDEFRREAFDVEALQYLNKPLDKAVLHRTLNRALTYLSSTKKEVIPIQSKAGIHAICIEQIVYIESYKHVLTFNLTDGTKIDTLDSSLSLEKLTESLPFPPFLVPYRGYIVNMNHVDFLGKQHFSMATSDRIPIPQKRFSKVRQQYSDYLLARFAKGDC